MDDFTLERVFHGQRVFIERLVMRHRRLEAFASGQASGRAVALYVVVEEFKLLKKELVINARDTAEFWFHRRWWRLFFALVCYGEVQMMSGSRKCQTRTKKKSQTTRREGEKKSKGFRLSKTYL